MSPKHDKKGVKLKGNSDNEDVVRELRPIIHSVFKIE